MSDPDSADLPDLTHLIAHALRRARDRLLERMSTIGLHAESGWHVNEELRETGGGTEWILSPIHLREPSPQLEERVRIDGSGRLVAEPEQAGPQ